MTTKKTRDTGVWEPLAALLGIEPIPDRDPSPYPPPADPLGYTSEEVDALLAASPYTREQFSKWMTGQTCAIGSDGFTRYYEDDVERFLSRGGGRATVWD